MGMRGGGRTGSPEAGVQWPGEAGEALRGAPGDSQAPRGRGVGGRPGGEMSVPLVAPSHSGEAPVPGVSQLGGGKLGPPHTSSGDTDSRRGCAEMRVQGHTPQVTLRASGVTLRITTTVLPTRGPWQRGSHGSNSRLREAQTAPEGAPVSWGLGPSRPAQRQATS